METQMRADCFDDSEYEYKIEFDFTIYRDRISD